MYFAKGQASLVKNFRIYYHHETHGEREILSNEVDYRIIEYHLDPERKIRTNPENGIDEMYTKLIVESFEGYIIEEFNPIRFNNSIIERETPSRIALWVPASEGTSTIYYVDELRIKVAPEPEPEPVVNRNYWAIAKEPWYEHIRHLGGGVFTNVRVLLQAFALFKMSALEVPIGETYTLSFEINVSNEAIQFSNGRFYINGAVPHANHNRPTLVKHEWVKVYATFDYAIENSNYVHMYLSNVTDVDTFQIRKFKLEKGDIATDWTLAPEDVIEPEPEPEPESNIQLVHIDKITGLDSSPQHVWDFTISDEKLEQQSQGDEVDYLTFIDKDNPFIFSYTSDKVLDSAKSRVYAYYYGLIDGLIDFHLLPMEQKNGNTLTFQINTSMPLPMGGFGIRKLTLVPELVAFKEPTDPIEPNINRIFSTYALNSDDYLQLYLTGFDERYSDIYKSNFNRVFEYPYNPITEQSTRENIIIGNYDTGATGHRLESNQHVINFKGIDVPELYSDSRDYEEVEIRLFLPFHSEVLLSVEQVINQTVSVQYVTDLSTGDFTLNIYSTISDHIIHTSTGIIGKEMPLYAQSEAGKTVINNYRSMINNHIYNPYIEVTRQIPLDSSIGFNTRYESVVGKETGYVSLEDVQLDNSIPSDKRSELLSILRQGVIINDNS